MIIRAVRMANPRSHRSRGLIWVFRDSFLEGVTFYLSLVLKVEWALEDKAIQALNPCIETEFVPE